MTILTRRTALLALSSAFTATLLNSALRPASAAAPALPGTYALPDGQAKVTASMTVLPTRSGAPSGMRLLDVALSRLDTGQPVTRYETELTKQLHLIAVSADFRTFLHEHGDRSNASNGHFRVPMPFPRGGLWHVYADATPAGLGQQVMRFELDLGNKDIVLPRPDLQPTGLESSDGRYAVRFDALDLHAGQEAMLTLHVLRDGNPAPDLTPFLGVAAHAVFISTADLTYVHVHAAPAMASEVGGTGAPMRHDLTGKGMAGMDMPGMDYAGGGGGHDEMPGMGSAPLPPGAKLASDLALHVRAPKAGTYALWLQFTAGGQVRTVRFTVSVT